MGLGQHTYRRAGTFVLGVESGILVEAHTLQSEVERYGEGIFEGQLGKL